jgi:glycerophosphoryl diester phosphodiesterase
MPTLVVAHRGASAVKPENTLAAFAEAVEANADGFELDVRLSQDGCPVIFHDETLNRVAGTPGLIREYSAAALKSFSIPTLDEILDRFNVPTLIEIKDNSDFLVDRIVETIVSKKSESRCWIGSPHNRLMKYISRRYPAVPVFFFPSQIPMLLRQKATGRLNLKSSPVLSVPVDRPLHRSVFFIRFFQRLGLRVFFWTVNAEPALLALARKKADGIITDDPARARKLLQQTGQYSIPG